MVVQEIHVRVSTHIQQRSNEAMHAKSNIIVIRKAKKNKLPALHIYKVWPAADAYFFSFLFSFFFFFRRFTRRTPTRPLPQSSRQQTRQ